MKTNKKRKGFTLIELIAVIAILGILALIIVPRVAGYTGKAKDASKIANAKTIVNAAEIYNSDIDSGNATAPSGATGLGTGADKDKIISNTPISTLKTVLYSTSPNKYMNTWPDSNSLPTGTTYQDLLNAIGTH